MRVSSKWWNVAWPCVAMFLLLAGQGGRAAAQVRVAMPDEAALQAFDAYVARAVRDWNVPGLAIALVHGERRISYGQLIIFPSGLATQQNTALFQQLLGAAAA